MIKKGVIDRFEKGVDGFFVIIELENRELLIIEKTSFFDEKNEGDEIFLDEFNNFCG